MCGKYQVIVINPGTMYTDNTNDGQFMTALAPCAKQAKRD